MEVGEQIVAYDRIIFWMIVLILLLVAIAPLVRKIRNRRLLKTVTSPKRGTRSERHLVLQLLRHKIPAETIFHDLCLEKRNGGFAQIDLVVATTEGIIVFEVKDYSGWIFGNGTHSHWTKVLAYGKKKYRFYNPIKQNQGHISTLQRQLRQLKNIPFFSMVVFYGDCQLKEINFVPEGTYLVKPARLFEVLKLIRKNNEAAPYINKREIVAMLKQAVQRGENFRNQQQHISNIKDMLGKDRIFD